jgi:hypothetical protein
MKTNSKRTACASPKPKVISGILLNSKSREPLPGFQLNLCFALKKELKTVAVGLSQLDGRFALPVRSKAPSEAWRLMVVIVNRFGREVTRVRPVQSKTDQCEWVIEIDVRAEDDQPVVPKRGDPFVTLKKAYPREIDLLKEAGIQSWGKFAECDLEVLSARLDWPAHRLEGFRLHAEMNDSSGTFTPEAARSLVAAGIKRRDEIAQSDPQQLMKRIGQAAIAQRRKVSPAILQDVPNWVAVARGWDLTRFPEQMAAKEVAAAERTLVAALAKSSPNGKSNQMVRIFSKAGAQANAIAEMRAIMSAAGIYDLSCLSPFVVRGQQHIGPGYHFSMPKPILQFVEPILVQHIVKRGAGFKNVKEVKFTDYGIHILPNPVKDAVILGPLIQYVQDAQLIIAKEVTSLIIITDEFDYRQINRIGYEDRKRIPPAPVSFAPGRAGPPRDLYANNRYVYTPDGQSDNGRNGLRGKDGLHGQNGFAAEAAPSLKLYVRSTPNGIPDIDLSGRHGGPGENGQDGGNGEEGARGRESCGTFWLFCVSEVGHGGWGGDGGTGGNGGIGGAGGNAGSIDLYTTRENLETITRRGTRLDQGKGPPGERGQRGAGGAGGIGGEAGHDTAGCSGHPEWRGPNGKEGLHGNREEHPPVGPEGRAGALNITLITPDQFNAAFHYPFLLRLEPQSGPPGTHVRAVGLNLTSFSSFTFANSVVPTTVNPVLGTVDFVVPELAEGGLNEVMFRLSQNTPPVAVPGLNQASSNLLHFRVTPKLTSVLGKSGPLQVAVPGITLHLHGAGFVLNSQASLGGRSLPLVFKNKLAADLVLPSWENIGLPAGPHQLIVTNPDGSSSNALTVELSLQYVVRMKAWRVYAAGPYIAGGGLGGGPIGTNREIGDVLDVLLNNNNSPRNVFLPHGIRLDLDPNIENAYFPINLAESFPKDLDPIEAAKNNPGPDGQLYFDPGAINIYFISDFVGPNTAWKYATGRRTVRNNGSVTRLPSIVFEDTATLSTSYDAIVAAHELGHVLSLPHVCSRDAEDTPPEETTFGRMCTEPASETTDRQYLMYPTLNFLSDAGTVITGQEAILVRREAALLHNA